MIPTQGGNPDLNFGILSDRYSYVFLGILSGILSDICSDILFAIASMGETRVKSCTSDGGHACTVVHSGAKLPLGGISLDKKTRHRKKPDWGPRKQTITSVSRWKEKGRMVQASANSRRRALGGWVRLFGFGRALALAGCGFFWSASGRCWVYYRPVPGALGDGVVLLSPWASTPRFASECRWKKWRCL